MNFQVIKNPLLAALISVNAADIVTSVYAFWVIGGNKFTEVGPIMQYFSSNLLTFLIIKVVLLMTAIAIYDKVLKNTKTQQIAGYAIIGILVLYSVILMNNFNQLYAYWITTLQKPDIPVSFLNALTEAIK